MESKGLAKPPIIAMGVRLVATCWAHSQELSTYNVLSSVPR